MSSVIFRSEESFDCLKDEQYQFWVRMLFSDIQAVVFRSVVERFPALADVLAFSKSKHVRKAMQMKREQQGLVKEKVGRRLGTVTDRPDFASYILKYNDEKGMTREEMYGNMSSIIAAGSETTATLLTGATWYLHLPQHRRILGKVLAEIRGTFKTVHEINLANLSKCEYFLAVIEETFRNYPPGLAGQPRIVPEGGDIVSGYFIPGGVSRPALPCLIRPAYRAIS